ncbi:hypothetical protein F0562_002392 [Nyssa sinensis]|uniref:START domain-containing protein n=1 Tax=Nyssa sinensis TaxID=561372 RepID=A0A5J5C5W0_9ASTE|nr:hypothetical protein F0562_002392 [Nyssa sinensis]
MNSDKELHNQCLEEKRLKPLEPSPAGNCLDVDMLPQEPEKASTTREIPGNTQSSSIFMEVQEANNISKAAYKELMTIALEAQTWVVSTPALGSLEEFLQMFRSPPPSGMRVERSIESAIVPVAPDSLVTLMMDMDKWSSSLSHIVFHGFKDVTGDILQRLCKSDKEIKDMIMMYAECQLPTPFVQSREFHFLRCLREIQPNIWAIVDLSDDYFSYKSDSAFDAVCQRRPSGLIVRRHDKYSQVIWIENVLVYEYDLKNGMDYGMISSNLAFSAKHWVGALIWKLKRNDSRFINVKMKVDQCAHTTLLNLTDSMKDCFLDMVNEMPDGIQAKPISVFDFLIKKNMELQWPSSLNPEEPEEVIKFASDDDSNCITLLKKAVIWNKSVKNEYMLREISTDGFCSFVISAPMTQLDVNAAFFFGRWTDTLLQPSGFAIMPGGSDGLHSDVSLVTIAMQQQCNISELDDIIEFLSGLVGVIIEEIHEEVRSGCKESC